MKHAIFEAKCVNISKTVLFNIVLLRSFSVDFFARGLHTRNAVARLP